MLMPLFVLARNHSVLLPYGKWTCGNGREVLFNREYRPIASRQDGVVSSDVDAGEWVLDIVRHEYYYNDGTPRRGFAQRLEKILNAFYAGR